MIEYLTWDSEFFGYKIGRIKITQETNLNELFEIIDKQKEYKLIYLVIDKLLQTKELEEKLEKKRISLVDKKVTFSQMILPPSETEVSFEEIKLYSGSVATQKIIDLSLQSGIYSRFQTDKNFVNHEYEKLYTAWIQNSVNGKIADSVFVAYQHSELIGLLTLSFKKHFSDIGILAVDSMYRGQKIGQKLIKTAIHETQKQAINLIKVVTQKDNINACNFYENQGFEIEQLEYIYHIWL